MILVNLEPFFGYRCTQSGQCFSNTIVGGRHPTQKIAAFYECEKEARVTSLPPLIVNYRTILIFADLVRHLQSAEESAKVEVLRLLIKCKRIDFDSADWESLDRFADRTVFQTREWLRFISESQNARPVLAELHDGNEVVGYFSGLTFSKFGVRVLGSSFPGWTTPYIGFNLMPNVSRRTALGAVEKFAWDELNCLHIEVSDPYFSFEDGKASGFKVEYYGSYRTDLAQSEEDLFNSMDSACRRCIRKAQKSGVTIEEAHDSSFADEYYQQLKDVFSKQGLVPTYPVERVRKLIENLQPTGRLLLLRARASNGKCIATGIFPGFNKIAEFWGNASFRASQSLRPNEAIHWYAMRYWKRHGMAIYDWGGEGAYKEKYGCKPYRVPWFTKSRYRTLGKLRNGARIIFARKQKFLGWLQHNRFRVDRSEVEE